MWDAIAGLIFAGTIVYLYVLVVQIRQAFDAVLQHIQAIYGKILELDSRVTQLEEQVHVLWVEGEFNSASANNARSSNNARKSRKRASSSVSKGENS